MPPLNKIYNESCFETLKKIDDNSIDLVVTSPPYNKTGFRGIRDNSKGKGRWSGSDIDYGDFHDDLNEEDYRKEQIELLNELYRVIKDNGSIFYNHKVRRADRKASHPLEWILKTNCTFYQQIIWDRNGTPDHNINYLDPTTELIFWLTKKSPKVFKTQNRFSTEIWRFPADNNNDHPAPFPKLLPSLCISLTTQENDLVYDPYMGSGTTALSSKELKRNFIGSDISKEYIELAEKRLKDSTMNLF